MCSVRRRSSNAEYNGVKCHAIFNPFAGRYFVDDVYGVIRSSPDRDSR